MITDTRTGRPRSGSPATSARLPGGGSLVQGSWTDKNGSMAHSPELNRRSVERGARSRGQPLWLARLVERRRDRGGQLRSAASALGDRCVTWSARLAGEPVAVLVARRRGERVISRISATDEDLSHRTRDGYVLHSMAIEDACRSGVRQPRLGESNAGSGVETCTAGSGPSPAQWDVVRFGRLQLTRCGDRVRALAGRRWPQPVEDATEQLAGGPE
jgi:GNAT acetyltransferase-like protein